MNASELYEKLQQIGKPLVHVESLVSTMQLEIPYSTWLSSLLTVKNERKVGTYKN